MKKNINVTTEQSLEKEFEDSKNVAKAFTGTTAERYHNFAKFAKTNKCKVQGGGK